MRELYNLYWISGRQADFSIFYWNIQLPTNYDLKTKESTQTLLHHQVIKPLFDMIILLTKVKGCFWLNHKSWGWEQISVTNLSLVTRNYWKFFQGNKITCVWGLTLVSSGSKCEVKKFSHFSCIVYFFLIFSSLPPLPPPLSPNTSLAIQKERNRERGETGTSGLGYCNQCW